MRYSPFRQSQPKEGARLNLSEIATALDVPVVIMAMQDDDGINRHATFGLEVDTDRQALAAASFAQCAKGATVVPNIAVHPDLSQWSDTLIQRGLRFMVGVPLFNDEGQRTGSICIVATQKHVAGHGIKIHLLKELGSAFLAQAD